MLFRELSRVIHNSCSSPLLPGRCCLQETAMNTAHILLQGDASPAKRRPLVSMAKELLADYFTIVKRALAAAADHAVRAAAMVQEAAADTDFSTKATSLDFGSDWGVLVQCQVTKHLNLDLVLTLN